MRIESLSLDGFRNIAELRLDPGPGVNLLVGRNAQGKTNIVEAIGLLSTGTSFRTSEFRDMIGWDATRADVSARVAGARGEDRIRVSMEQGRKGFERNGKRALARGPAALRCVLFAPEEIMLLRSSPAARRRYLDSFISQLAGTHRSHVSRYEKIVRQRNRILTDVEMPRPERERELVPWDEQLAEAGARIVEMRARWVELLNRRLPRLYGAMAPGDGRATLLYAPQCGEGLLEGGAPAVRAGLARQIEARRDDEFARCTTLVGPHRDDLEARIGSAGVKSFGSQGQHRSFVLALKLSEMEMLREEAGDEPILLLDDVASELDRDRNRLFFDSIAANSGQAFVTATSEGDLKFASRGRARVFVVSSGEVVARK
ncbi:MAG: DNA replication/repair protein RecF [Proteobacteria bacterium]|nr:DNA replication/repair protein RecF [Pseudomonadota bacterium]